MFLKAFDLKTRSLYHEMVHPFQYTVYNSFIKYNSRFPFVLLVMFLFWPLNFCESLNVKMCIMDPLDAETEVVKSWRDAKP